MASNMMPGPEPEEPGNCPECDGTGWLEIGTKLEECDKCGGIGHYEFDWEDNYC